MPLRIRAPQFIKCSKLEQDNCFNVVKIKKVFSRNILHIKIKNSSWNFFMKTNNSEPCFWKSFIHFYCNLTAYFIRSPASEIEGKAASIKISAVFSASFSFIINNFLSYFLKFSLWNVHSPLNINLAFRV